MKQKLDLTDDQFYRLLTCDYLLNFFNGGYVAGHLEEPQDPDLKQRRIIWSIIHPSLKDKKQKQYTHSQITRIEVHYTPGSYVAFTIVFPTINNKYGYSSFIQIYRQCRLNSNQIQYLKLLGA